MDNSVKNRLFNTDEGKLLLLGLLLILITGIVLFLIYFIDIHSANSIFAMIATNLFVGRVPSLSLGYASGLPHSIVIGTNVLVEMVMVLILYPLFIFSFNNILHIKFLEKFFNDVKVFRVKHQTLFDRYGILGLFVFVFFPFWMTGPIVGSIIGFLIGLRHITIISVVFIATVIAISLWGLFLNEIVKLLNSIDSSVVPILLIIVIGGYIIYRLLKR